MDEYEILGFTYWSRDKLYGEIAGRRFNYVRFKQIQEIRNLSDYDIYDYYCIYQEANYPNYFTGKTKYVPYPGYSSFPSYEQISWMVNRLKNGIIEYGFVEACAILMDCDGKYFYGITNNPGIKESIIHRQVNNINEVNCDSLVREQNIINWKTVYNIMENKYIRFESLKEFLGIPLDFEQNDLARFSSYQYGTIETIAWLLNVPINIILNGVYPYNEDETDKIPTERFINMYQTFMLDGHAISNNDDGMMATNLGLPPKIIKWLKSGVHQINCHLANRIARICSDHYIESIQSDKPLISYNYWEQRKPVSSTTAREEYNSNGFRKTNTNESTQSGKSAYEKEKSYDGYNDTETKYKKQADYTKDMIDDMINDMQNPKWFNDFPEEEVKEFFSNIPMMRNYSTKSNESSGKEEKSDSSMPTKEEPREQNSNESAQSNKEEKPGLNKVPEPDLNEPSKANEPIQSNESSGKEEKSDSDKSAETTSTSKPAKAKKPQKKKKKINNDYYCAREFISCSTGSETWLANTDAVSKGRLTDFIANLNDTMDSESEFGWSDHAELEDLFADTVRSMVGIFGRY